MTALVRQNGPPMGLLVYDGAEAVGWCAAGPRTATRVLRAPTLKGRDKDEDSSAWLVPCFLIRDDHRRSGIASSLLIRAVELAVEHGATAIEGFPLAGSRPKSSSPDFMTGTESLFEACGFSVVRRPSNNRVIMRRSLRG